MTGSKGWTSEESVDWDNIGTEPPPPLEVGVYKAIVTKAEPEKTSTGKPALKIELLVQEAYGGEGLDPARKMFDNVTLTKEAAFRVKQLAAAAGITPPASFAFADAEEFCAALVEADAVWLRSKRSTWEGKVNHKVDRYLTEEQAAEAANAGSGNAATSEAAPTKRRRKAG